MKMKNFAPLSAFRVRKDKVLTLKKLITMKITIDESGVMLHLSAEAVWMTQNEIARLFGVYVSTVGANVRSILKNKILRAEEAVRETHHRDGSVTTHYNLEMVTALAFRLDSWQAAKFRPASRLPSRTLGNTSTGGDGELTLRARKTGIFCPSTCLKERGHR
jgi:hypothetical protein